MAGHRQNLEADAQFRQVDPVAVLQQTAQPRDLRGLGARTVDRHVPVAQQQRQAADVVRVVVGDEDRRQFQPAFVQRGPHHFAVPRVDHGGGPAAVQQPQVVVLERGEGRHGYHVATLSPEVPVVNMPNRLAIRGGQPFSRYTLTLWLRSPRGRRLVALEERELRRVLPDIFGRHILQIGNWGRGQRLLGTADTLHRAVLGTVSELDAQSLVKPEQLPVMSHSVDAVLLPHTLEFTQLPHNVLRETSRILNDRGRLLILGFNPWSLWG